AQHQIVRRCERSSVLAGEGSVATAGAPAPSDRGRVFVLCHATTIGTKCFGDDRSVRPTRSHETPSITTVDRGLGRSRQLTRWIAPRPHARTDSLTDARAWLPQRGHLHRLPSPAAISGTPPPRSDGRGHHRDAVCSSGRAAKSRLK